MVQVFQTVARAGVIHLPEDAPSTARCMVTILDDVEKLRTESMQTIPEGKQRRMSELLLKNREGTLTATETDELNALSEEFDAATLTKGRALAALAHLDANSQSG